VLIKIQAFYDMTVFSLVNH